MHELGITRSVVEICAEQARGATVRRVTLEIGQLSAVMPDAVRFCFDVCAEGTPLAGAALHIVEVPGQAVCRGCGTTLQLQQPYGQCECGSVDLRVVAGEELIIKDMEVV